MWIAIAIVVVLLLWLALSYNRMVQLKALVEEAFSGMDVFLKKRYDLIPNLVETVKGYAAHESETLENVVKARNAAISHSGGDIDQRVKDDGALTSALRQLMVVVEQYPNLKADTQFLDLQRQLQSIETDIAQSRKYYNGTVRTYNVKIRSFPTVLIAGMFGFTAFSYYEVQDESERQNVKVSFSK